jgi:D-aminopeptidase
LNGFGKSIGLIQVEELGTLETPILLTNTLNVGIVSDALIEYMLERNPEIGVTTTSVNPVVMECNDSFLNDIRGKHVKKIHVINALENARDGIPGEGAVGAGTGMSAFELKGGIGTSSRIVLKEQGGYTVGVLALTNFGMMPDLMVDGVPVGQHLNLREVPSNVDGSIIIVIATDAPLSSRQLGRVAKRATHGLARTGSISGHGSGDVVIAFSNTKLVPHFREEAKAGPPCIFEEDINGIFRAAIEAVEEAILDSIFKADSVVGRDDNTRVALPLDRTREILERYGKLM